jgi:hypothetical protein
MPLSSSNDAEVAFSTLGLLLKARTPGVIEKLRHYLDGYKSDAEPLALIAIGSTLSEIGDVSALSDLEELSGSNHVAIKLGALDAIRRMKSRASVPVLVRRLRDPNQTAQYVSLITLAEIFGKLDVDYAPAKSLFDKNPRYYTNLWEKWWAEQSEQR